MEIGNQQSCLTSNHAHVIINQLDNQNTTSLRGISPNPMPFSLDPQPAEDEIECANCGALIYYELTRCPSAEVDLYEPDDQPETGPRLKKSTKKRRPGEDARVLKAKSAG